MKSLLITFLLLTSISVFSSEYNEVTLVVDKSNTLGFSASGVIEKALSDGTTELSSNVTLQVDQDTKIVFKIEARNKDSVRGNTRNLLKTLAKIDAGIIYSNNENRCFQKYMLVIIHSETDAVISYDMEKQTVACP